MTDERSGPIEDLLSGLGMRGVDYARLAGARSSDTISRWRRGLTLPPLEAQLAFRALEIAARKDPPGTRALLEQASAELGLRALRLARDL